MNYPIPSTIENYFLFFFFFCISFTADAQEMDNKQMEKILKTESGIVEGENGAWQALYKNHLLIILTDETNNRMRIFTPIVEESKLDEGELEKLLIANFHSALDAKYALYESYVVAVFTHPLKELTVAQLKDAMLQVATLSETFRTTYSSTELIFGGGQQEAPAKKSDRINKKPSKS